MKISEFKRWLAKQGIEFKEGAKHTRLFNPKNGKHSALSRQQSAEIGDGLRKTIIKQLGL